MKYNENNKGCSIERQQVNKYLVQNRYHRERFLSGGNNCYSQLHHVYLFVDTNCLTRIDCYLIQLHTYIQDEQLIRFDSIRFDCSIVYHTNSLQSITTRSKNYTTPTALRFCSPLPVSLFFMRTGASFFVSSSQWEPSTKNSDVAIDIETLHLL